MDIAILAPRSSFPKVKKLAQLFRSWGGTPKNHRVRVFTTKDAVPDYANLWKDLDASIEPVLSGVVRMPPMSENEPFRYIANSVKGTHWFYMPPHTVPLCPDWADKLEKEYLGSGKQYLGVAGYIPKRYRDSSGIDRVAPGDPYILESAVYPANFLVSAQKYLLSTVAHHEVSRRQECFPKACLTESIVSAEWSDAFRLKDAPHGALLATRLADDSVINELLGNFAPPAPEPKPEPESATADSAQTISFPVKEPTIKVISRSPTVEEAVTLEEPVKRPRGRPRKA